MWSLIYFQHITQKKYSKLISKFYAHKGFDTIVAVRHPYSDEPNQEITVVSPCGMCRELISDYAPHCFVLLEIGNEIIKTTVDELIPYKYKR